ncbi:DNA-binding GntR family transcriptional regulator [Leucobacter exalbidus]|uniref:DNA-binding GntR family transcriptional regulator n=1 Tax=Leucobacter exalbidus TaxID=662960 RepID=A0A940T288_9MICO|nr:GntR family transcriptional regulator [Leucobacter exalbidus]MBP1327600.1 DNA-binding GntR family transcriptional regulator [Leucobacter exalbidus]
MAIQPGTASTLVGSAERAYQHTKQAIIHGDLAPGAMISEGQIAEELGISRTPVHEAFLRLDVEELLTLASRKGAVVRPMAPHEAADVLEMREAIEAAAASRVISAGFATALTPALDALLATQAEAIENADFDAFVEADDAFHTAVVTASRNPIALTFTRQLWDRQQRLRHQLFREAPQDMKTVFEQHGELAQAVKNGGEAHYRRVLAAHVSLHRHQHGVEL